MATLRPSRGGFNRGPQYRYPPPVQINPQAPIAAAQRDYARRTPGVLGASNGGSGLMPAKQWDLNFPNRRNDGTDGIGSAAPPTDAAKAGAPPAKPADLNSAAVQGALNAVAGSGKVVPNTSAVPVKTTVGSGTVERPNGTGNTLVSTFGTGSSHQVPAGTPQPTAAETAAATTATGVIHPDAWQTAVMKAHPEIGQPGTEGNKAFASAYANATQKQGAGNFDPVKLAKETMQPIYDQRQANLDTKDQSVVDQPEDEAMLASQAKADNATAAQATSDKVNRPFTPGSTAAKIAGGFDASKSWPDSLHDAIADHVTGALTTFGLHPDTAKEVGSGIASTAIRLNPVANAAQTTTDALDPTGRTVEPALPGVNSTTASYPTGRQIAQQLNGSKPATADDANSAAQAAQGRVSADQSAAAKYTAPDSSGAQQYNYPTPAPKPPAAPTPSVAPNTAPTEEDEP